MKFLGVDTGGTFTDFVYVEGDSIRIHKVLSTPEAPERAILQGIDEMAINFEQLRIVHGSTVATNAVLEAKGAKTVYVTNRGLKDVLTIGRQARQELYNLQPAKINPPVPEEFCLETGGRLSADGSLVEALTELDIKDLKKQIDDLKPESVAINLLFSFLDARFEKTIARALGSDYFISCSHQVLSEYREYERGITTWLNAYVGPLVQGYLQRLEKSVAPARVHVMRSSGQSCLAKQAGHEAVNLLLSGPAGGLTGAQFVSALSGEKQLLTFDMGGTSTDVAMIDGDIVLGNQGRIGPYPVAVPMVDIHTIGAGGGSIAHVDAGGALHVGPVSAGASPGPACYGQGGKLATVTDANLILGYLPRSTKLAGSMPLDFEQANTAMKQLKEEAGLSSLEETALGVIRIANENMVQALRVISVERGIDPRGFALAAFGGAGGLHVCALADELGMKKAIAPIQSGVLSALGMLVTPPGRQLSRTVGILLDQCDVNSIESFLNELEEKGKKALIEEGVETQSIRCSKSLDLCYKGQSSTLNIHWSDVETLNTEFHQLHRLRYGHVLDSPIELINVRVSVNAEENTITLPEVITEKQSTGESSEVYGLEEKVPVLERNTLPVKESISGPVIIVDAISTIYLQSAWQAKPDRFGNLLLNKP